MNRYRNGRKAVEIGNSFWDHSEENGIAGIVAELDDGHLTTDDGHSFINFSCCSYLDLDSHPLIIEGAVRALRKYGVLDHCISRARVQLPALLELEDNLSDLFSATVISTLSASTAAVGLLPLIASGHLSGGISPLMVFDKTCHASMSLCKPICADETEVCTCNHHDLDFLEDCCRKHEKVCYICDGTESLGGYAPVDKLREFQSAYGLLVYYDDSHSLSVIGKQGEGYVRQQMGELDQNTIVVTTLNKAFGTSGAAIMLGNQPKSVLKIVERFAGPLGFSQPMNMAAIGASLASADLHRTDELELLQTRLQDNVRLFDQLLPTAQAGNSFPIRLVSVPDADVVRIGSHIYRQGFYVSPVFFPIVARGTAGLRVMLRAGQCEDTIHALCEVITKSTFNGNEVRHNTGGTES